MTDEEFTRILPIVEPTPADAGRGKHSASGPQVVKLRAVRTEDGYRSVYAELTRPTFGSVLRTALRTTGELLITFGLIVLLFAGYQLWGKSGAINGHQDTLNQQIDQAWAAQPPGQPPVSGQPKPTEPPAYPGSALARLYVQKMRKDPWVVVEGVTPQAIARAPGHYPKSALPGQDGNFSVAGHREVGIFRDMQDVQTGDVIVVETKDTWYIYKVFRNYIVKPTAVEVVSPVPPGTHAGQKLLTLTTCNPWWDNYERMIVHAELTRSQPKTAGRPAELK